MGWWRRYRVHSEELQRPQHSQAGRFDRRTRKIQVDSSGLGEDRRHLCRSCLCFKAEQMRSVFLVDDEHHTHNQGQGQVKNRLSNGRR